MDGDVRPVDEPLVVSRGRAFSLFFARVQLEYNDKYGTWRVCEGVDVTSQHVQQELNTVSLKNQYTLLPLTE